MASGQPATEAAVRVERRWGWGSWRGWVELRAPTTALSPSLLGAARRRLSAPASVYSGSSEGGGLLRLVGGLGGAAGRGRWRCDLAALCVRCRRRWSDRVLSGVWSEAGCEPVCQLRVRSRDLTRVVPIAPATSSIN